MEVPTAFYINTCVFSLFRSEPKSWANWSILGLALHAADGQRENSELSTVCLHLGERLDFSYNSIDCVVEGTEEGS